MATKLIESLQSMRDLIMFRNIRLLSHLLVPLFLHGIAHEMSSPYLMEVISSALCPGETTCSDALYLNNLQKTVILSHCFPLFMMLISFCCLSFLDVCFEGRVYALPNCYVHGWHDEAEYSNIVIFQYICSVNAFLELFLYLCVTWVMSTGW